MQFFALLIGISRWGFLLVMATLFSLVATIPGRAQEAGTGSYIDLSALPHILPELIAQTDHAGSHYFSILDWTSIPREQGRSVVFDVRTNMAFLMDEKAQLLRIVAQQGRGPGELNDITSAVPTPEGGMLIYDQKNRKILHFGPDLALADELIPEPYGGATLSDVYPAGDDSTYIMQFFTNEWLTDREKDPELVLVRYDRRSREYGDPIHLYREEFARQYIDDVLRGGTRVPFSPSQLVRYRPDTSTLVLYLTGSRLIAEVDSNFDTLRVVPVRLPPEAFGPEDMKTIEGDTPEILMEIIRDRVPDTKVPVENLVLGPEGEFWLRLNYRSEYRQWLVLDVRGKPLCVVQLPKHSRIIHVNRENLAVRQDAGTLTLYYRPAESIPGRY